MKRNLLLFFIGFYTFHSSAQVLPYKVTVYDSSKVSGYYFFSQFTLSKAPRNLVITDKYGDLVCFKPTSDKTYNFVLQPNGIITFANSYRYFMMDSEFRVVDSVAGRNMYLADTHDLRILPNGHFLMLGMERFAVDVKKNGITWQRRFGNDSTNVRAAVIQEQDAQRNVVWEWHAKDHFDFADVDTFFFDGDWTHSNAIEVDYDGNILLSSRFTSEITKINRTDGSIMWRLGGHRNEFKFVNCPVPFRGQHDIRRIANGDITLFDNGEYKGPGQHGARALEFKLDENNKIATLVWSYTYDTAMVSDGQGTVQRLPNSNTLVNFGRILKDNVCFVIVDTAGSKIFELDGLYSYRTSNYPSLPWHLHQPEITSRDSAGITYLEAEPGYSSYYWSNGSSERIIPARRNVTYSVLVPYGDGAFVSSKKISIKNK